MNIQQQINELQSQLDELKAQAAECEEPEIDWSKMIGRNVIVWDFNEDRYCSAALYGYDPSKEFPFNIGPHKGMNWRQARLYQGPTRPNWIEWSGGECPVDDCDVVLFEMRSGEIDLCAIPSTIRWSHVGANGDILRYTIIEP